MHSSTTAFKVARFPRAFSTFTLKRTEATQAEGTIPGQGFSHFTDSSCVSRYADNWSVLATLTYKILLCLTPHSPSAALHYFPDSGLQNKNYIWVLVKG